MQFEYYEGQAVPVFESIVVHNDILYGLMKSKNDNCYYLWDNKNKPKLCIKTKEDVQLKLGKLDDEFGVFYFSSDGADEGFCPLPV